MLKVCWWGGTLRVSSFPSSGLGIPPCPEAGWQLWMLSLESLLTGDIAGAGSRITCAPVFLKQITLMLWINSTSVVTGIPSRFKERVVL